MNPYSVVEELERRLAEWCGSKYAVAVESCSAAIFLCLQYYKIKGFSGEIHMPNRSYPSVPCSIIHAGFKVRFEDADWEGEYQLWPLDIWDSALRLKKGMYHGGMQCLSFHVKKLLPVGRGGMVLLNDANAYEWLKLARFDGRQPIPLQEQKEFNVLGYNMYLEPANAARAIQLFEVYRTKYPHGAEDLNVEEQKYCDLSLQAAYKQ